MDQCSWTSAHGPVPMDQCSWVAAMLPFRDPVCAHCHHAIYHSFMGFSLGSVIIRSALTDPALRPYIPYLYTYLSLSGPHCGFLFNPSFVVDSGMWVMKNWKKSKSLQQLSLGDHPDKRDTYIYQLSQQPGDSLGLICWGGMHGRLPWLDFFLCPSL